MSTWLAPGARETLNKFLISNGAHGKLRPLANIAMKQQTLATANGFERYRKRTRRTESLEEMELLVPWAELCARIEPVNPKAGNGRHPVGSGNGLMILFPDAKSMRGAQRPIIGWSPTLAP